MVTSDSLEQLQASLRSVASRLSEIAGGNGALVFARLPGEDGALVAPALRAAAGFDTADAARDAAQRLETGVREACETGTATRIAEHGAHVFPLAFAGRSHGALAVVFDDPPSEALLAQIGGFAPTVALHVDHAHLSHEVQELRTSATRAEGLADEKSDELLRLSEELFAQDIELLRSNEKLGKIEKLKNDFIEKMSRELRTPLNSIIEAIISVLAGEADSLSDPAKESLRIALDEGTAFGRTLQNIVELWRIKQGELPVESMEVNFTEVVEEAIFSVQDTLGQKPVTIEKEFPEPLPKVRTDLAKVNQILFLLLDNAAKFTTEGTIVIHAVVRADTLVCEVRDTGIGICPDDHDSIFDEFYQVDEFRSSTYPGAGLGLTLVRDLAVLLEGELELKSEPGKGTCVTFRIPVTPV